MTVSHESTLVFGLAIAGQAVARELVRRGESVVLADDAVSDLHQAFSKQIGMPLVALTSSSEIQQVLNSVARVAPAPGIPEGHPVIVAARELGVEICSELEIAYRYERDSPSGPRPMVGITGTDGKTTTTMMTAAILESAGLRTMAVGNTDVPLISALNTDARAFAVECSSFRLAHTQQFRMCASAWLNFAPDHLDWHPNLSDYFEAKAKMWAHCEEGDVAVAPVDDLRIIEAAQASNARVVTFGIAGGDYHSFDGWLCGPMGRVMPISEMGRSLPHDVSNALAAIAVCLEAGLANVADVASALQSFKNAPHRIQFVGEKGGVRWFNDSKATSPHAVSVALNSFENIVLIAGGKNKGLDLSALAEQPSRMRAVVAIGDASDEIAHAFTGVCEIKRATSMQEAVNMADSIAQDGDVVLLSPGCTSYDWYANYGQRGEDFMKCVGKLLTGKE
ncbi:MAG: UDP-N-acetylmuramoyl-L-alanine--D-glutamate ligase [Actinobacteria bacterium]|nr:UDP-N-acetylmuramoyl-L-alanine--D-glutamate ligase [Actinomycetota bacterium]